MSEIEAIAPVDGTARALQAAELLPGGEGKVA